VAVTKPASKATPFEGRKMGACRPSHTHRLHASLLEDAPTSQQYKVTFLLQAREAQRAKDLLKERDVLDELNAQMRANQAELKRRAAADKAAAQAALAERDAQIQDLQEQVRRTFYYHNAVMHLHFLSVHRCLRLLGCTFLSIRI